MMGHMGGLEIAIIGAGIAAPLKRVLFDREPLAQVTV